MLEEDGIKSYVRAKDHYCDLFGERKREKIGKAMDIFLEKYGWDKTNDHRFTTNFIKRYINKNV